MAILAPVGFCLPIKAHDDMTELTWSGRCRHNIYVGMAAAPVIWVSLLIGEGARIAPAISIGILAAGQIVVLVSMYLAWRHFSLRQLIVLVSACAVMWAIAIPGIQKHREFTATVHGLRRYGGEVYCDPMRSVISHPISWRFQRHRIDDVVIRDRSVNDICEIALLLKDADFDGRLRIEGKRCTDDCMKQIAKISGLRKLSISVTDGPTDVGMSMVLGTLDLVLLKLERRKNWNWRDPTVAMGPWKISDASLKQLSAISELKLVGLDVEGSFLNSIDSPERLFTLHVRECSRFKPSLSRFTNLSSVTIHRCPVGNETMRELTVMPSLRRLEIHSR